MGERKEVHDVKSRDRGNLEKSGEGQGRERSLEGEEGKPTGGSQEAETEGGYRRDTPKRLSEESTEAERRKTG